ncbi:MAG TPA: ABC-ATPase domain-containing protein [Kiritimatiellia bacterium]|nr:ABC-ATPase domain-containing protein [Kiritimatiellia bacterium]HMO98804.1 ABC-ATPase domain-containing protein [Kiritimatiellia bacterium]HMP96863.1 ABC-ATPase domain-containing protein [Kiritimatiellia bacterium]
MKDKLEFFAILQDVDGREAAELNRLLGDYDFNRYVIKITQYAAGESDQFLPVIVRVNHAVSGFPESLLASPIRRTALEDYLARTLSGAIQRQATFNAQGVARRRIVAPHPGQKILPRSTVQIADDYTDVRLRLLVPRQRDRIDGAALQTVFFDDLPVIVQEALLYCNMDGADVERFVGLMEDVDEIRQGLAARGLISFVGAGSMLFRQSGSDLPDYEAEQILDADPSRLQQFETSSGRVVKGVGISAGVTLILGDDYSGRVELMRAIAAGIYNHIPGDGREYIVTMPDTVYVAADPGRSVQRVDLGCLLGEADFSAAHADAAHAQAASLVEGLEAGARVIVLDESDSCPGFLGSDARLEALAGRPARLTPLAARAQQLFRELGVSTVVAGRHAVGSFIPVADVVLLLENGVLRDITAEAKAAWTGASEPEAPAYDLTQLVETARWLIPPSIDSCVGRRDGVIDAPDAETLIFGRHTITLGATRQIADVHQALTIGLIIEYARQRYLDEPRPIRELLDLVERDLSTEGLDPITRELRGDLARPRRYEIAAALNRLPSLRVSRAAL